MKDAYSSDADELVLGTGVTIGEGTQISGGRIVLGDYSKIGRWVEIKVTGELNLGKSSKIGDHSIIRGREIRTGREFYLNHHAEIGGGSCYEATSKLIVGYWFHLGSYAMVNTAMPVEIGDEVGLGRMTNVYTHAAYLSEIDGFPVKFGPVKIGNRVWMPSATVNPGVTIGNDVVIGVGSVVTHDVRSGSLAMGIPCKVVKQDAYPVQLSKKDAIEVARRILESASIPCEPRIDSWILSIGSAAFDLKKRTIQGEQSDMSERARELLRRHGIRFKAEIIDGVYLEWQ